MNTWFLYFIVQRQSINEGENIKAKRWEKKTYLTPKDKRWTCKKSVQRDRSWDWRMKWGVRLWICSLSCIMRWWTEVLEKVRRKKIWRREREREGGHIVFVVNWCDPSEPCDSCSTLPEWPAPRHTQGQLELHSKPLVFFAFFFFLFLRQ